jgi:ABC-2 type transport system permease protein
VTALAAVCRYEFRMQVRKGSLWAVAAILAVAVVLTQGDNGPRHLPANTPARVVMGAWSLVFALLMPIGFGMVLADRLVRDRRLRVARLLESTSTGSGTLLAGKYLGGMAATALPGLVALLLAAIGEFAHRHDPALFGWALLAFVLVTLPGLAMIAGFALVCPLVVGGPLFRVLFVGYWFWGNMLTPSWLPSLTGTLITPIGDYAASWLVGNRALYAGLDGWIAFLRPNPGSAGVALLSVALICLAGLLPLLVARPLLQRSGR